MNWMSSTGGMMTDLEKKYIFFLRTIKFFPENYDIMVRH